MAVTLLRPTLHPTSILAEASRLGALAKFKPAADAAPFFKFENSADDPAVVEIQVVDFIGDWIDDYWGFGVTARSFVDQLSKLSNDVKTIRVHINSPGGDVFSATNIANALRDQQLNKGRSVETICDGLAASAASIILMAGNVVKVADNGLVMIHNPWVVTWGEAKDLRQAADELDTVRNTIIATYKWHSSMSDDDIIALMDATTWMDADEAIAKGFATEKIAGLSAAAMLPAAAMEFLNVPEKHRTRVQQLMKPAPRAQQQSPSLHTDEPMEAIAIMRACREAGCPELAEDLVAKKATQAAVTIAVADAKEKKAAAVAREKDIRAICKAAKLEDMADDYVAGGMTVERVRAQITTMKAKLDKVDIDSGLEPGAESVVRTKKVESIQDVYARRRTAMNQ